MAQPVYRIPQSGHPGTQPRLRPVAVAGLSQPNAQPSKLPFVILCLYTFVLIGRPQDYVPALQPFRLAMVFTIVGSIVTLVSRERIVDVMRQVETKAYLFFFAALCIGIPFSLYRRLSFEFVFMRYITNVVFFLLFVIHVNTLRRYKQIVLVLAASALLFSVVGLQGGYFRYGRFATGSDVFDPNDVAFFELCLLPFTFSIVFGSFRPIAKLLAFVGAAMGVVLILLTASRGGLLGLVTVLLLFLLLRIGAVSKARKALLLSVIVIGVATNADNINVERFMTLGQLENDYNLYDETGRAQIWRRGLQLYRENPFTGVGVTRFGEAIGTMRKEEEITAKWQAAHNSYLQILTETGTFGAIPFVWLIITCLRNFNRLRRRPPSEVGGLKDLAVLPGVLLIGFAGQLVAATFLSQGYSLAFTLFFAASASLKGVVEAEMPIRNGSTAPDETASVRSTIRGRTRLAAP